MNLLYLTTSFPPFMEAHTIRNIHYINKFIENGDRVFVCAPIYCQSNKNFEGLLNNNIKVIYTRLPILARIGENLRIKSPNGFFMKGYNYLINYIYPDSNKGWDKIAYKELIKRLPLDNINCIVSASGSYTAHILAGKLIEKHPQIKWVAEYGDPWGIKGDESISTRAYRCEAKLLRKCSKVVFTTQETVNIYKKYHHMPDDLYIAIYGGYDAVIPSNIEEKKENMPIKLAYIGVAYRSSRNLENIIISMRNQENVILKIIGRCSEHFKVLASELHLDNIQFTGQVRYSDSIKAFTNNDAFVIIGNDSTSQIPSKIYNYIASKKPIIYISQMKDENDDPTQKLLHQFGGILYCKNTIEEVRSTLKRLRDDYDKYLHESMNRSNTPLFLELSWDYAAQRMVETVHTVLNK